MSDSVREEFARRFVQALEGAGYDRTQVNELAEFFEVSPQAVRKWMSGEAIPKSSRLPIIASQFGVRHAWLIGGELPVRLVDLSEKRPPYDTLAATIVLSDDEAKLLGCYRRLPRPLRRSFAELITESGRHFAAKNKK